MSKNHKNRLFSLAASIAIVLSLVILPGMNLQPASVSASGTTYYVSNSSGNDNNSGTSENSAWQSLNKVSSITFQPGDHILFKRGDTWTGQTLYLNTNNASSSNWVYVSAYGTGNKPVINGGGGDYSIKIYNSDLAVRNCGWNIQNLEITNSKMGLVLYDMRPNIKDSVNYNSYILDGLWVENCYFHDISGCWWFNGQIMDNPGNYPDDFSAGIRVMSDQSYIYNVTIKNNDFLRCDVGIEGKCIRYFDLIGNTMNDNQLHGMTFWGAQDGVIRNNYLNHGGLVGKRFGNAGIELDNGDTRILIDNNEISNWISTNQPDGCAIDFECFQNTIYITNNYIHDNSGRPLNYMGHKMDHVKMINNLMVNNGWDSDYTAEPAVLCMGGSDNYNNTEITGNVIVRQRDGQGIFNESGNLSDTVPNGVTFSSTNTVLSPGSSYTRPAYVTPPAFPSGSDNLYTWSFASGTEGWTANNISDFNGNNGALNGTSYGSNSYIESPDLNFDVRNDQFIKIRLKNNSSANKACLYFLTSKFLPPEHADVWEPLDSKHKYFTIQPNSDYTDYYIDLSVRFGYSLDLLKLRVAPMMDTGGSFSIDSITLCNSDGSTPPPPQISSYKVWDFNGSMDNWSVGNAINNLTSNNGNLEGIVNGYDPSLYSSDNLNVDITTNKIIKIRMKNDTDALLGQIYFTTTDDQTFDATKGKNFAIVPNDTNYTEYRIDMSAVPGFTGTLKRLRIDPTMETSGSFSIDYVQVGKIPAVQNQWNKVDDFDSEVSYAQAWYYSNSLTPYRNSTGHYVGTNGYAAEFTFEGSGIRWIGAYNSDHGSAQVYIDNNLVATVNTNSATWQPQQVLYENTALSNSTHTIRIVSLGSGYTDIDGFEYYLGAIATPTPTATATPTPTTPPSSAYAWEFGSDAGGWWAPNDISNLSVNNGNLEGTITGNDPYMVSNNNIGVASSNNIVTIRMKNNTNSSVAELFFNTNSDDSFDGVKHTTFSITPNDLGYTTYTINMSGVPGWSGVIKQLRLDPNVGATGSFSIDYIRIGQ